MNEGERQMRVEEIVRTSFQNGTALFWPEQLVDAGLGTRDEILETLSRLVSAGKLEAVVQVRSSDDHICWQGTPEAFAAHRNAVRVFRCEDVDCGEVVDDPEGHTFAYFRIAPAWKDVLSSKKAPRVWSRI